MGMSVISRTHNKTVRQVAQLELLSMAKTTDEPYEKWAGWIKKNQ